MPELSRVPPKEPVAELTWTCLKIATSASNYGGWASIYYGFPIYMIAQGLFSNESWVDGKWYTEGDPANKETTRAVCSLTKGATVVARLYALGRGYYYHKMSCTVTEATNEDPDCVDLLVTIDLNKAVTPDVSAPAGYYDNLRTDIAFFSIANNNPPEMDGLFHYKNVRFDTAWNACMFMPNSSPDGQLVGLVFSLGGGTPDLGTYDFAGAVASSYAGGTYTSAQGRVGEHLRAYVNCMLFSGYTVVESSIYGIMSSVAPNSNQWPDLITTTTNPDAQHLVHDQGANYGLGNWIVLTCPDGVSQLCMLRTGSADDDLYFYWSPGGLFSAGNPTYPEYRPTASDEINIDGSDGENLSAVCTFYGFKGLRDNGEISSRILVTYSPAAGQEQIIRMINHERFVTDIPASVYPRNVCFVVAYGGYYHTQLTKINSAAKISMPDGKQAGFCVSGLQTTASWGSQNTSDNKGTLDGTFRLEPIYLSTNYQAQQFFGYLPDMYWGDALELSAQYKAYTFNELWTKFGAMTLPPITADGGVTFEPFACSYAETVSDNDAYLLATRTPGTVRVDRAAPTFAGVVSATVIDDNTVRLTWESASDDTSAPADLSYEIHHAPTPGAAFAVRDTLTGVV